MAGLEATSDHSAPPSELYSDQDSREPSHLFETRNWDHSDGNPSPPEGVQGKLKPQLTYWKTVLKASNFIVDVIESGYKIPFIFDPPPFYAPNNRSSLEHSKFVQSAIADLLRKRCIAEIYSPHCCNPLTVAKGKKLRLVLDLRHPNQFVYKSKFKYEDLKHISQVLDYKQYYISFDLESGYDHVDIFPPHQKYLGFSWRFPRQFNPLFRFPRPTFRIIINLLPVHKAHQTTYIPLAITRYSFVHIHRRRLNMFPPV